MASKFSRSPAVRIFSFRKLSTRSGDPATESAIVKGRPPRREEIRFNQFIPSIVDRFRNDWAAVRAFTLFNVVNMLRSGAIRIGSGLGVKSRRTFPSIQQLAF